ncbi:MAG: polysaccharide biosynthesis tyrosine autokinase [Pirellulales bacterium]|nr:polysaccharide biosynthesis tyrosine autokinase [Pirellulales bacterium]
MSQVTSDSFEALHTSSNGETRSASRALVVRDHESQTLSPYMLPGGLSPFGSEPATQGLNFTQLMHALRRRWLLAMIAGLMVGLPLATLVWLITPSNYEVIAWLKVGDAPAALVERNAGFMHRDPVEYEQYRKTQSALIKSPDVLRAALNNPAIANLPIIRAEDKPEEFLKDEISVAFPLESEVLQIKMRGRDKSQLVKIVNAVKDSYLKNVVDLERQKTNITYDLFDREVKANNADIARLQSELKLLAERSNSKDVESVRMKAQILMNESTERLRQLNEAKSKLLRLNVRVAVAKDRQENGGGVPEHMVQAALMRDPGIGELSDHIGKLENALMIHKQAVKHPEHDQTISRLEHQIAGLHEQLDQKKSELRPTIEKYLATEMAEGKGGYGDEPKSLEEMLPTQAQLEEQVKALQTDYDQKREEAASATQDNAGVATLEDEIKRKSENIRDLESTLSKLKLQLGLPNRVTTYADAIEPEAANPMLRIFLSIFAGIVGLAVGAGGVLMMEYQARRVNTTSDLSIGAGLRVLGTVPNLSKLSSSKGLNGSAALQGILAESVDSIRTMLLTRDEPPRVVVLTSAGDSEGKTTVATHLAASLARSGRRTLLVDGDLRSPSIHAMFNAAPEPGVCEVIRGEADFEGVLQPTPVDGLMLVAAGQCDYQCIAALSKDCFKDFVEKAREQFEYVIIDSAPVLTYADMLLMGAHVDAAVLSVRRDVSQMHRVYEARERMESVGIRVLGAVVNGLSETSRRPAYALPSSG